MLLPCWLAWWSWIIEEDAEEGDEEEDEFVNALLEELSALRTAVSAARDISRVCLAAAHLCTLVSFFSPFYSTAIRVADGDRDGRVAGASTDGRRIRAKDARHGATLPGTNARGGTPDAVAPDLSLITSSQGSGP